jgi:hypothetical protein
MTPEDRLSNDERIERRNWFEDARLLLGQIHDTADPEYALILIYQLAGSLEEMRQREQKRLEDEKERRREHGRAAVPPVEIGAWGRG